MEYGDVCKITFSFNVYSKHRVLNGNRRVHKHAYLKLNCRYKYTRPYMINGI